MKIEDLNNIKLGKATAGYLAMYMKLSDLYDDVYRATISIYGESTDVDDVCKGVTDVLSKAQDEVMKLAALSITENLLDSNNHTEI